MWPDCNPTSNIVMNSQHYTEGFFVAQSRSLHQRPWTPEQISPPDAAHSQSQCWAALHHPPCISVWLPQSLPWARCPGSLWSYSRASLSLSGISCDLQTTSTKTADVSIEPEVLLWKYCRNLYRKVGAGTYASKERKKPVELSQTSRRNSHQPCAPSLKNSCDPKIKSINKPL